MPGSSTKGKFTISQWYRNIPSRKYILDIGPGWGTYSRLLRRPGETWHAVEIHQPYVERFRLNRYYDTIFIEDVSAFKPDQRYDVVILGDVLEHLTNEKGIQLLKKILTYTRYCIISLPLDAETGAPADNSYDYWQNKNERHLASWSNKSFLKALQDLPCDILRVEKYYELGVYLIASSRTFSREKIPSFLEWLQAMVTNRYSNHEPQSILKRLKQNIRKLI